MYFLEVLKLGHNATIFVSLVAPLLSTLTFILYFHLSIELKLLNIENFKRLINKLCLMGLYVLESTIKCILVDDWREHFLRIPKGYMI